MKRSRTTSTAKIGLEMEDDSRVVPKVSRAAADPSQNGLLDPRLPVEDIVHTVELSDLQSSLDCERAPSPSARRAVDLSSLKGVDAYVSHQPLICSDLCAKIDMACDEIGEEEGFGHYIFAKRTLHVNDHPSLRKLTEFIKVDVLRIACSLYNCEVDWTKNAEPHIVVYDAEKSGFTSVEYHTDSSDITFIVSLNKKGEDFVGGGTLFEEWEELENGTLPVELEQGQALFFLGGEVRHAGAEISSGKRTLLVGFLKRRS